MVKRLNPLFIQFTAAMLILAIFLIYIFNSDRSSAWFYNEYITGANYQIGQISFLVYGKETTEVPVTLFANAPTRFYELGGENGEDPDENFNDTVGVNLIYGKNAGDVRVYISMSYDYVEPDVRPANSVFYYLFVPIINDPEDDWYENYNDNFKEKKYSDYLEETFSWSPMDSTSVRRAAFEKQNEDNLKKLAGLKVEKDESANLCYLLFWPEYDIAGHRDHDFADWGNDKNIYREFEETMTITVHASQFNNFASSAPVSSTP